MEELHELIRIDQTFADRVLHYTGMEGEDLKQLLSVVMAAAREGNLCIEESALPSLAQAGLARLRTSGDLFDSFLRVDEGRVYLQKNWVAQQSIIEDVQRLSESCTGFVYASKFSLNADQENAVKTVLNHRLTLLTGGPGTGKTYTAAAIVEALRSQGVGKILLTAPTGRAADHLSKSIEKMCGLKFEGGTLHRILKIGRTPPWPKENFTLDADLLIVDESSMIDAALFATLLKAIPKGCITALMGDPNQLSPVGIGSVFSDLVNSTRYSVGRAQLQSSMRTENREIIDLANAVLQGKMADSFLTSWPTAENELFAILKRFMRPWTCNFSAAKPDPKELFSLLSQVRLLNSLRQGPFGTETINCWFLEETKRNTPEGSWWWAPLMICRNDERTALSNGEMGIYMEKKGDRASGAAYFNGREEPIPEIALPIWEYAFCSSVHKSQGSEYDEVLVVLPVGSESFGREMLYTSITRAKKKVSLLADPTTVEAMVKRSLKKHSGI